MALLPASLHVDQTPLRSAASANHVALASEGEFKDAFPDCETGAMPPFGNLYDMPVYADACFVQYEEITFTAGTHRELVRMHWEDLVRLVKPTMDEFTYHSPVVAA